MAAWIAEALTAGHDVDGIVMLAASLSPGYPLDKAIGKSRKGIVNFYSPHDWVFLGLGTATMGTLDGEHSVSAGARGFDMPHLPRRRELYENNLFQIPWREGMAQSGHLGGHLSSGDARFVAIYVAPLVRARRWNDRVIKQVLDHKLVEPQYVPSEFDSQPAYPSY